VDQDDERLVLVGVHDSERVRLSPTSDKERLADPTLSRSFGMLEYSMGCDCELELCCDLLCVESRSLLDL
jgi:hypothetical protein